MAEKLNRKELKQPDALQRAGLEARSWLEGKEGMVLGIVGGLVLLGGGVAIASYVQDRGAEKASEAFGAALQPVTRPVSEGAPADPNATEKPFTSQKEKDEAIVQSLTAFRTEHKGTPAAKTAALALGQAYYRLGQLDQALAAYDEYLKGASGDDPLRALALEGKGYVHEAKGQLDQALEAFGELAKQKKIGFLDGMGLYHQARVLITQGKPQDAAKLLSQIPADFPGSAAARLAGERASLLAAQGITLPPPQIPAKADAGT